MARAVPPLWLARPSRFAGMRRVPAAMSLVALALLLLAALTALAMPPAPEHGGGIALPALPGALYTYGTMIDGVRAGGDYYSVAAEALREGGLPLDPLGAFRPPTLAVVAGALPGWGVTVLLYALAIAVAAAWFGRLREAIPRPAPLAAAMVLLAGGMLLCVQADFQQLGEVWAALLVALSLAIRRPGRWIEAVATGLMAMLVHEMAALYVLVMAILALAGGARREAAGWAVALAVFGVVLAVHADAVAALTQPLDPAGTGSAAVHGLGLFAQALAASTALQALPLWLGAPLVALALFGWAAWDSPLALRVATTLAVYAAWLSGAGRPEDLAAALVVAPVSLIGLAFLPDALRDLVRAILDRRRVRVQRITR